jgi:thymidylate synthase
MMMGTEVSPRGKKTKELLHHTVEVDMRMPVLRVAERKLNYQFMAAEAFWILSGSDRLAEIAPWNKRIADYSDDGERMFGAYGPKVIGQVDYVVAKLLEDPDTRQAGLTIWRENPPKTKDVPCTVAMFFSLRTRTYDKAQQLHAHVFMRSNDVWLGTPYDVFTFSMVAHLVCGRLNKARTALKTGEEPLSPGKLHLTAASSHLYEENWAAADFILRAEAGDQRLTPLPLYTDPVALRATLRDLRDTKPGDVLRWWER